jgi:hypothetical protein
MKQPRAVVVVDGIEVGRCQSRDPEDVHRNGRHVAQIRVGLLLPKPDAKPMEPEGPQVSIVIHFPQELQRLDLNRLAELVQEREQRTG